MSRSLLDSDEIVRVCLPGTLIETPFAASVTPPLPRYRVGRGSLNWLILNRDNMVVARFEDRQQAVMKCQELERS